MPETLIERIYEAAFVPELWPDVLAEIAQASGSYSGALLVIDRRLPPLFTATPNVVETLASFATTPHWYDNVLAYRLKNLNYAGFLERSNFVLAEERTADNPYQANMDMIQADWQVGSAIDLPTGELAVFTFERQSGLPDFTPQDLGLLDGLRPHLGRAALLATRLKLERAQASVATMDRLGIPAAVALASGVVVATNALFEHLGDVLRPAAFGRLVARDREADRLLQAALPRPGHRVTPETRSFPMHREEGDGAIVVHVIPLQRGASDIFDSSAVMVAVTGYAVTGNLPSDTVLRGLFDLSAAEAGIAADLSAGLAIKDIAVQRRIAVSTVRTHLAQIFRKTGTSQQGQLIALLKGISGYRGD